MIRKKDLLSSVYIAILFSTTPIAVNTLSAGELRKTNSVPFIVTNALPSGKTALATRRVEAECIAIDDSTATGWNAGKICLTSDINTSTTSFSAATDLRVANLRSAKAIGLANVSGAECISDGGSSEATGSTEGFCMAADLIASEAEQQHFSFKNGLGATGMQFLQATFGDGSTQSFSTKIGSECLLPDGFPASSPANGSEKSGGFCLASGIKESLRKVSSFSFANAKPMVGLQFLQVRFEKVGDGASFSRPPRSSDAECLSIGGSSAKTTGRSGGFCLTSDLSFSALESANFSIAHNAPVTDLQFLQVTFRGDSLTGGLLPPLGAECTPVNGSTAATGNPGGFCLVSDLIRTETSSSDISIANGLPVSGLQFIQATFTNEGGSGSLFPGVTGTECTSTSGSSATTGNTNGFCLASDRGTPTTDFANFSIANDLPISTLYFMQVPVREDSQLGSLAYRLGEGAPMGTVVFDPAQRFRQPPLPTIVGIVGHKNSYFRITQKRSGIEIKTSGKPVPEYWLSL